MNVNCLKLLLVEDNALDAERVSRILNKMNINHSIDRAISGDEALSKLKDIATGTLANQPDIILLDLNLPGLHGLEILSLLKSEPKLSTAPLTILTTSNRAEDVDLAKQFNLCDYIQKPLTTEKFEQILARIDVEVRSSQVTLRAARH